MRAIILGLPGSGTSYYAGLLKALGFEAGETFARGRYPYPTYESLLGRAINRLALGQEQKTAWPKHRWAPNYEPRSYAADSELKALADQFCKLMDKAHENWFFKNPETLLVWNRLWNRIEWDLVLGVYRHPQESIERIHWARVEGKLRKTWLRHTETIVRVADMTACFPGDEEAVCEALGFGVPDTWVSRDKTSRDDIPEWAAERWNELEEKRCLIRS